ncbi:site-specific DNA-methyltransferase [Prevotella pectinovora]|uniref:site-specific DNA-methyltransferase n=2 Tax=Prevotella pectinovora TaxID=1602169 RepID=UPI00307A2C85
MNKYELAKKITQLEGLTNEEKASLVELLRSQKKYGLVWEDKPEEIETRLVDELPVLTEVPERAIVSESPDAPNHILIEGDNLEALTALAYTHEGKIDVIYIDPPYNTGNKDFVYNDSYVDREDGYRHSKWLSFMNKRLQIAKSLLSSGGVIFISIDDNEQAQLKLLCDEIFGSDNFITNIIWQSTAGSNTGNEIVTTTEYVLVYTSNRSRAHFDGQPPSADTFKLSDEYVKERGRYTLDKLDRRRVGGHYSEALNFPIEMPDGTLRYPGGGQQVNEGWNYLWSKTKVKWGLDNNFIVFKKNKEKWAVYCKRYQNVDNNNKPVDRTTPYRNLITSDLFNTAQGTAELANIFNIRPFAFPKPSGLVKFLLSTTVTTLHNATILDFFAGSGTTLHATMQLNAEDGGHRKCILVTNNENNICEEVTYERNKRVIQGYTTPKGEEVEGLHDNNLRYYRTNFLSRDKSVKNMRQLVRLATDMLCIKNDVYTEAEFCGKKINPNIARYFDNGQGNRMLVIYEERAIQLLVQLTAQTEDDGIKTMVYVFSPGADPYTDDFEDIAERVKLCALPSAIYEAYKRVLPKRKPKFLDEALQEMKAQAEAEANVQQTLDFGENDNMNEEGGEA